MKSVIASKEIKESEISRNQAVVKSIVSTVKHAIFNDEISEGYAFIQEVTTRFGTTFDVVECFTNLAGALKQLLAIKSGETVEKINKQFLLITSVQSEDGATLYLALGAIVNCFEP